MDQPFFVSGVRLINPNDPTDIVRHDRMVTLFTQMLDLNTKLQDARLEQREDDAVPAEERRRMERSINGCTSYTG
jgi:hypothetical protein